MAYNVGPSWQELGLFKRAVVSFYSLDVHSFRLCTLFYITLHRQVMACIYTEIISSNGDEILVWQCENKWYRNYGGVGVRYVFPPVHYGGVGIRYAFPPVHYGGVGIRYVFPLMG